MRNLKFVAHTTNKMPKELAYDTLVVYRTTSTATALSHVHHPMKAGLINWDSEDQYMGTIRDYALIPAANAIFYDTNDDSADYIPLINSKA